MARKDLPEDVIAEILARLPVKSLVRFKCLGKFYCALMTNPRFVTKHLHCCDKNHPCLLIFCCQSEHSPKPCITMLSDELSPNPIDLRVLFPEMPPVDLGLPEIPDLQIDLGLPSEGISDPQIDLGLPSEGISDPQIDLGLPSEGISDPQIDLGQPSQGIADPQIDIWLPFLDISVPPFDLDLPILDLSIDFGQPFPEISHPRSNLGPPNISQRRRANRYSDLPLDRDVLSIVPYGPCNGIFCLYGTYLGGHEKLILWNPAIREVKVLPLPRHWPRGMEFCMHGFGIDPKTNTYKVVSISMAMDDDLISLEQGRPTPAKVEVYNLSTNSWKIVNVSVPDFSLAFSKFSSHLNGVYHWLSEDINEKAILCFDMSDEVFRKIRLPPVIEGDTDENLIESNVAVVDAHIAYVKEYSCSSLGNRIEIWVMNDYGVHGSWVRKYNIGPHLGLGRFRGFWKDGEILAAGEDYELLVSYDLETQQPVQEFPVRVGPTLFQAFTYVESMVPISVLGEEEA